MESRALRTSSNPHTRSEPQSWGEAIQNYRQEKQVLPFALPKRDLDRNTSGNHANTNHPSVHPAPAANEFSTKARHPQYDEGMTVHTRYMKSRQEAAYNPITGTHLNHSTETAMKTKEQTDVVTRANRGQDRALAVECNYNVVNFRSKREGLDAQKDDSATETVKTYIPDSRAPYNIISTLSHEQHHWAPPAQRPQETVEDPKTRFASKFIGRQPYNIVNNKFLDKHEEKTIAEAEASRTKAVNAFWKTHSYDPVQIRYYDDEKETEYHERQRDSETTQGQSVAENIRRNAPTAHLAEGNLYDPVTCQPKNEDAIGQLHRLEQGKVEHSQQVLQRVGEYLQNEDDFSAVQDDRALNRSKWKRFEDDHSHGFDVLNNIPHFGRGAEHKHLPKARPEPTAWEQINEEALNSIDAQPLGDISYGGSVEHEAREVVDPSVPPLKTRPFTDIQPTQPRSAGQPQAASGRAQSQNGSGRLSQPGGGASGRSQSQGGMGQATPIGSGRLSNVSTSGRIRTGGFQHLEGSRRPSGNP